MVLACTVHVVGAEKPALSNPQSQHQMQEPAIGNAMLLAREVFAASTTSVARVEDVG
jgi:hypothetical protein